MIRTAVVIAGGRGERLRPLTDDRPKGMVSAGGQPLLHWVLRWLKSQGIERVVIGVAYRGDVIVDHISKGGGLGMDVRISEHTLDGGTAQGFRLAIERHVAEDEEDFLAMNCDEITNLSVANLEAVHRRCGAVVTMALAPFFCRFSVVDHEPDGRISGFKYGRQLPQVPVSIGVYLFNRAIRRLLPQTGSVEDAVFTHLVGEGRLAGYMLSGGEEWVSVNDMKNIREAEEALRRFGALPA
jgi:NDP-sugar pyrophosphorylase family protein